MGIVQEAGALVAALSPIQLAGAVLALVVGLMQPLQPDHSTEHMLTALLDASQLAFHVVPYLADPHGLKKYPAAGPFGLGRSTQQQHCITKVCVGAG